MNETESVFFLDTCIEGRWDEWGQKCEKGFRGTVE